jgi:hypothetical protein
MSAMLKDVFSQLDYSSFQEVAMLIFGLSFIAVCCGALWLRNDVASSFGQIPVEEDIAPKNALTNGDKGDE